MRTRLIENATSVYEVDQECRKTMTEFESGQEELEANTLKRKGFCNIDNDVIVWMIILLVICKCC